MAVLMLLAVACGNSDSAKLVGSWSGNAHNPDATDDDFNDLPVTMEFAEDGRMTLTLDAVIIKMVEAGYWTLDGEGLRMALDDTQSGKVATPEDLEESTPIKVEFIGENSVKMTNHEGFTFTMNRD